MNNDLEDWKRKLAQLREMIEAMIAGIEEQLELLRRIWKMLEEHPIKERHSGHPRNT